MMLIMHNYAVNPKFVTKSGGDKIFNRLTQGRFRRGLMDRGGDSCKGVGVIKVKSSLFFQ